MCVCIYIYDHHVMRIQVYRLVHASYIFANYSLHGPIKSL